MFESGKLYHRLNDIHAIYGGQESGTIVTPPKHPVIFLFANREPRADFGFRDRWLDGGKFQLIGEGDVGKMTFTRGNRAVRDHVAKGKTLHLFEITKDSDYVIYRYEMIYESHFNRLAPDINGNMRDTIVFVLQHKQAEVIPELISYPQRFKVTPFSDRVRK